tara:strand:- start:32 stop:163 length:132 start_codon:yes stop_codon:yes gene_type:complete
MIKIIRKTVLNVLKEINSSIIKVKRMLLIIIVKMIFDALNKSK